MEMSSRLLLSLAVVAWLLATGLGLRRILVYEGSPGPRGATPIEWPADSQLPRAHGVPTLVVMVHPRCPCSRASIGELAILMTHAQGLVKATVVFVKPAGLASEWEKTDVWTSAGIIPGVTLRVDEEGTEARLFGSQTSGQAMLYGPDGKLLFSGGITSARGHAGDNDGRRAILSLLTRNHAETCETPVFGCPLFGPASAEKAEDFCDAAHSN